MWSSFIEDIKIESNNQAVYQSKILDFFRKNTVYSISIIILGRINYKLILLL